MLSQTTSMVASVHDAHAFPAGRRGTGMTLVEILVVVAIAAVLATIAVPSLQSTVKRNRVDAASNQFVAMLSMARSEAVKQGSPVTIASTSGTLDWSLGWTVTACQNNTSVANGNCIATTIQASNGLSAPMTNFGTTTTLAFDSMGRLLNNGAGAIFILCADGVDPTVAKGVTVALMGRPRIAATDPASGLALDDQNNKMAACNAP